MLTYQYLWCWLVRVATTNHLVVSSCTSSIQIQDCMWGFFFFLKYDDRYLMLHSKTSNWHLVQPYSVVMGQEYSKPLKCLWVMADCARNMLWLQVPRGAAIVAQQRLGFSSSPLNCFCLFPQDWMNRILPPLALCSSQVFFKKKRKDINAKKESGSGGNWKPAEL